MTTEARSRSAAAISGLRRIRRGLVILACLLVLKGVVWAVTLPPFDTPDEKVHFQHAELIAEGIPAPWSFAIARKGDRMPNSDSLLESSTLVFGGHSTPRVRLFPERAGSGEIGAHEYQANHTATYSGGDPTAAYGPVTYSLFAIAIRLTSSAGVVSQVMGARVVSILLGAIAALATVFIARDIGLADGPALLSGLVVGFQPMWSQQTASANTEAGVFAWCTIFLALLVRWMKDRSALLVPAAALALMLALLSKPAAVFAVPFLFVLALPVLRRGLSTQDRLRAVAIVASSSLLALTPWVAWTITHPSTLGPASEQASYMDYLNGVLNLAYVRVLVDDLWGNFGWLEQQLPHKIQESLWIATLVSAALVAVAIARPRATRRSLVILLVAYFLACIAVAFAFDIAVWRTQGARALQSRYFLPAMPAIVIAAIAGLQSLIGHRWLSRLTPVIAALTIGINLIALETLWNRFYVA